VEGSPRNSEGQVIVSASRDLTQNQGRSHGCRHQFQPSERIRRNNCGVQFDEGSDGTVWQESDAIPQRGPVRGECGGWEGDSVR